jgi:hypothetical protein
MNSTMGLAQPARKAPRKHRPEAAGIASGRYEHDWTGMSRWNCYVHCARCGQLFIIGKAKGVCNA